MNVNNNKIANPSANIESREKISVNPDAEVHDLPRTSGKPYKQKQQNPDTPSNNNACKPPPVPD